MAGGITINKIIIIFSYLSPGCILVALLYCDYVFNVVPCHSLLGHNLHGLFYHHFAKSKWLRWLSRNFLLRHTSHGYFYCYFWVEVVSTAFILLGLTSSRCSFLIIAWSKKIILWEIHHYFSCIWHSFIHIREHSLSCDLTYILFYLKGLWWFPWGAFHIEFEHIVWSIFSLVNTGHLLKTFCMTGHMALCMWMYVACYLRRRTRGITFMRLLFFNSMGIFGLGARLCIIVLFYLEKRMDLGTQMLFYCWGVEFNL